MQRMAVVAHTEVLPWWLTLVRCGSLLPPILCVLRAPVLQQNTPQHRASKNGRDGPQSAF